MRKLYKVAKDISRKWDSLSAMVKSVESTRPINPQVFNDTIREVSLLTGEFITRLTNKDNAPVVNNLESKQILPEITNEEVSKTPEE